MRDAISTHSSAGAAMEQHARSSGSAVVWVEKKPIYTKTPYFLQDFKLPQLAVQGWHHPVLHPGAGWGSSRRRRPLLQQPGKHKAGRARGAEL